MSCKTTTECQIPPGLEGFVSSTEPSRPVLNMQTDGRQTLARQSLALSASRTHSYEASGQQASYRHLLKKKNPTYEL